MSLRIFHVIFIAVCIALSAFVAVWGVRTYVDTRSAGALALGLLFIAFGAALAEYGRRTFTKLRELP